MKKGTDVEKYTKYRKTNMRWDRKQGKERTNVQSTWHDQKKLKRCVWRQKRI